MKSNERIDKPDSRELAVFNSDVKLENYQSEVNTTLIYLHDVQYRHAPHDSTVSPPFLYASTLYSNMQIHLEQWAEAKGNHDTVNLEKARVAVLGDLGVSTWLRMEGFKEFTNRRTGHLDMVVGVDVPHPEGVRIHRPHTSDSSPDSMEQWYRSGNLFTLQQQAANPSHDFETRFMPQFKQATGEELDLSRYETIFPYIASK